MKATLCAILLLASTALSAAQSADKAPASGKPSAKPPAASVKAPEKTGSAAFDKLVKAATEARLAERWDEAIKSLQPGGETET